MSWTEGTEVMMMIGIGTMMRMCLEVMDGSSRIIGRRAGWTITVLVG